MKATLFEPATESEALAAAGDPKVSAITPDDPDLLRALRIHGLELVGA